ncbi:hypothetical protein KVR01_010199 [Diaporthe batatas]|uniref:ubiquitin-protein ligase TUL1 n=1 Tax=Diaporthe batatas TaxID=748121 RepID=UPI001D05AF1C|nr:ubiquitin-protein ligase TUL1 [Diaporthe batatas]KAG8159562.1 hypothetical protein KVR01_010199 [Diaporthe batatas]
MPPPHQENLRVLAIILIIFWLTTSSGDGQAGYFATPFLTQERLARQRHSYSVLNSTKWGDFNPRQQGDPPNGTEHTRYINITGFRQADGLAWEDLGLFRERCLETSRNTSPFRLKPRAADGEPVLETGDDGAPAKSLWDMVGTPTWLNATGLVKGDWTRREASSSRTWSDYNFTAMTPGVTWGGTHGEWSRNVTGSEGTMQLRVEDKKRHMEYDEAIGEHHHLSTGGSVREVAAGLIIEDSAHDGSGGQYEMRLHGVHWPAQGNMLLTTTSEKFGGIFGLPHLTPDESFFESSQQLLNQTVHEVLSKKERSAFTDQNNPWASSVGGVEDSWNPSPHCEWVVYLQVHPLNGNDLQHTGNNMGDVVKEIEKELRYPTGAPLPHVPDMRMSAVLYSPDCAYFLESKGPPHFPQAQGNHLVGFKEEVWISNLNFYLLAMAAIVFGQVHLLKSQMRESYTPSTMGRVSFWTIIIMVLVDGMMFTVAAALSLDSPFFLRALILTFALFMSMMIGGSFLGEIYKVQESEWRPREREHTPNNTTPRPPSTPAAPEDSLPRPVTAGPAGAVSPPIIVPFDQDIDAEIAENAAAGAAAVPTMGTTGAGAQQSRVTPFSSIIGRLFLAGSCISFLSLAANSWWKPLRSFYVNTLVFAYLSLWVPQIIRNMYRNSRRAFSWRFMIGQSVLRILPVAYFYLRKRNVIFAETDWMAFLIVAGWLWTQLWVLAFQDVLGPRFGMPKGWMPEAWDYHPILREDNLEAGGLPIGLVPSTSNPGSPTLERVRSLSLSSAEGREKSTTAVKGMRIRAIECAICQEALEVPVVKAGQVVEPAGGGVPGVLERRKYMVTPCRHIFHSVDESSWYLADFRQPLVSLCLVSRRLRHVAQQVLHHEFVLGYGDSWRSPSFSWDRRLTSFLRTIGERPDLAAAVRRVSLHPNLLDATELGDVAAVVDVRRKGRGLGLEIQDESRPPRYQGRHGELKRPLVDYRPTPGMVCVKPVMPYGRRLRMRHVDDYTCDDSFRERHALGLEMLAILIGSLPSVERLSIQQSIVDYETPYLSALGSISLNKRLRLLKTLDIAAHDYMYETMLRVPLQAAGILELAKDTLQTLNLHMCRGFWTDREQAPIFKSLKTLRLTGSRLGDKELDVLLSCCTAGLTSFTYEASGSFRPSFGSDDVSEFHPPEAIKALRIHSRTLKTLHLDLRRVQRNPPVQPLLPASLADFTALEDLFLSLNTLWIEHFTLQTGEWRGLPEGILASPQLPELLPPNVKSLDIAGRHRYKNLAELSTRLLGLARAVAEDGKLHRLRKVRCDSKFKRGLDKGLGPDIDGLFQGAGVDFGFGCWPLSETTITHAVMDLPAPLRRGEDHPTLIEYFDDEEHMREKREEAERSRAGA